MFCKLVTGGEFFRTKKILQNHHGSELWESLGTHGIPVVVHIGITNDQVVDMVLLKSEFSSRAELLVVLGK